eukprot:CAMPEP_0183528750 /NCGR_PEP_ID=MMETSP0371-20130417/22925_1 /TAXON_ID=268820 /ORGANISM="Peridinium aciculiferum, Strain PAER-2" /LENGTH=316 /DNA_ID=CAMNT_0025728413 /DNA_START=20 /DNA_END=967 /DNA_ORIENTATION=+
MPRVSAGCGPVQSALVSVGLSPQGAGLAWRHLCTWLNSEEGREEVEVTENIARASGDLVLHIGDAVCADEHAYCFVGGSCIETLQDYDSQHDAWKVVCAGMPTRWVRACALRVVSDSCSQSADMKPRRVNSAIASIGDESSSSHSATSEKLFGTANGFDVVYGLDGRLQEQESFIVDWADSLQHVRDAVDAEVRRLVRRNTWEPTPCADACPVQVPRSPQYALRRSTWEASSGEPAMHHTPSTALNAEDDEDEGQSVETDEMWESDWASLPTPSADCSAGTDALGRDRLPGLDLLDLLVFASQAEANLCLACAAPV